MSKPKTVILLYDNCVLFEVTKTAMEMARGSEVLTASLDPLTSIKTMDGFQVTPHIRLDEVPFDEVGCLVITGGPPETLYNHPRWHVLEKMIVRLYEAGKLVCGICGGVLPLVASVVILIFIGKLPLNSLRFLSCGSHLSNLLKRISLVNGITEKP